MTKTNKWHREQKWFALTMIYCDKYLLYYNYIREKQQNIQLNLYKKNI